jgi:hypothetical protein
MFNALLKGLENEKTEPTFRLSAYKNTIIPEVSSEQAKTGQRKIAENAYGCYFLYSHFN